MKGIEKSVFGSFFEICEYDSHLYNALNRSKPYVIIGKEHKEVTVIKIVPFGTNGNGTPIFCFELVWG